MQPTIRVSLFEDNASLRDSLGTLISMNPQLFLAGAHSDATHVLEDIASDKPDVVLMDIDMPGISGIEATHLIHQKFDHVKVLMLTVFDDDNRVFRSICAGAVGYLLKKTDPMQIIASIFDAHSGGAPITPSIAVKILGLFKTQNQFPVVQPQNNLSDREKEILTYLTKGQSYKMIADTCGISIDTVRYHIKNIYEKLHVHSMTEAVSKALNEKLI